MQSFTGFCDIPICVKYSGTDLTQNTINLSINTINVFIFWYYIAFVSLRKVLSFIKVPITLGHFLASLGEIDPIALKTEIYKYR